MKKILFLCLLATFAVAITSCTSTKEAQQKREFPTLSNEPPIIFEGD